MPYVAFTKTPPRARFAPKVERRPIKDRKVPEWRMQAECIARLHKKQAEGWRFEVAGDMNAAKRSPREISMAKVTGMTAGEPDIRVYGPHGTLLLVELKVAKTGRVSDEQKARHGALRALGHKVEIVQAKTAEEAADAVVALVGAFLGVK